MNISKQDTTHVVATENGIMHSEHPSEADANREADRANAEAVKLDIATRYAVITVEAAKAL